MGHLYYQYQVQDSDSPTMKNGTMILKPSDVLHIPGLGFDGLVRYSPIAMAGTKVLVSSVSMLMIHNPATIASGDAAEMQKPSSCWTRPRNPSSTPMKSRPA